jgi:hypothetical protein
MHAAAGPAVFAGVEMPDEAVARIKLEDYVPGEVLQHITIDRTMYRA